LGPEELLVAPGKLTKSAISKTCDISYRSAFVRANQWFRKRMNKLEGIWFFLTYLLKENIPSETVAYLSVSFGRVLTEIK
jgi:hypothetical protein